MRADIVVSVDPNEKDCADREERGRETMCLSLKCWTSTFDAPFDIERVVDSLVGASSSTSKLTTPNFGSPSPKNLMHSSQLEIERTISGIVGMVF